MSNTCMRYSKRALAPIVSLVTLLFNNVLWLGSRAKSPPGKGIQQETLFALHSSPIILFFVFCGVSWVTQLMERFSVILTHLSTNLKFQLLVGFWLIRHLAITLNVSGWVMVYFYFICNLITFPLTGLSVASCSFSHRLSSGDFSNFHFLLILSHIYICITLCV